MIVLMGYMPFMLISCGILTLGAIFTDYFLW